MTKRKKTRPRLKVGDRVKVIKIPADTTGLQGFLGRVGRVSEPRSIARLWGVTFTISMRRLFYRHELKLVKKGK